MSAARLLHEYFRTPESYFRFSTALDHSGRPGFFRFGDGIICYGHTCGATHPADTQCELRDVLRDTRLSGSIWQLPFDPEQVVENLLRERYISHKQGNLRSLARRIYYCLRPVLGVAVRKYLQRISLRQSLRSPFPSWPVDSTVNRIFQRLMMMAAQAEPERTIPFIWFWPDGRSGCASVTHDVETIAGLEYCGSLMDLNDSHGIKSSFQLIPEGRYHTPPEILHEMRRRGFEINIQDRKSVV